MMKHQYSSLSLTLFLVLFVSTMSLISLSMAGRPYEQGSSSSSTPPSKVYIVIVKGDNVESHYLSILSSVLGGPEAARESLVTSYRGAIAKFAAKLTPEQALELKRQPEVTMVLEMLKALL